MRKLLRKYRIYLIALVAALLAVSGTRIDVLERWNLTLSDSLYQQGQSTERRIVILGIDDESLEFFGPIQTWTRDIYADAIDLLCMEEENRPAVVGMDVLFAGESDPDVDEYFSNICSQYNNIVVAENVIVQNEIIPGEDNTFIVNDYGIENVEEPYSALKEVTEQGFWNNMLDIDGIVRTGILMFDLPDGTSKSSLSYCIYQAYARENGLEENLEQKVPMNSRHQWYIPFLGYPNTYEAYSLSQLFTGEIAGSDFTDCIVLIGPYTEGLQDSYLTAIDHAEKMFGVEIHANMIDAMIEQNFKGYASALGQDIFLFLVVFLAVLLFQRWKMRYSTVTWLIFSVGYVIFAGLLYKSGQILEIIFVPLFMTIIYVVEVGQKYLQELLAKRKVVNTFKRYVAPQVVDEIFKVGTEDLGLGGKLTDIACLFVDIRGFTPMSEILEPPQVVEILNNYLNLTNACILNNEGTLDKFIGDATMAIYNAPLPLEDYIYKAVKTAWDMVAGAEALKQDLLEKYGRTVSFGVGVHCGKAVVGNIGTKMRMDYTAIGDTVNTAARLEANAKAGQVLISRAVYDALEGRIEATSLGDSIKLKGKSDGFEILRLEKLL